MIDSNHPKVRPDICGGVGVLHPPTGLLWLVGLELCAGLAVLPGTLWARGNTTTPPGTLSELCGTSWIFVRFSQYNQPPPRLAPSSLGVMALPVVARPLARSSRFFVSPLIGGAQQRGLRPRHSPNVPHPSPPKPRRTEGDGSPTQVAGAPPRESGAYTTPLA